MARIIQILVNAAALWVAVQITEMDFTGAEWWQFLLVAVIFSLVNTFIKPILKIITLPITAVTLGLFLLVINALMLLLTGWLSDQLDLGFMVNGFVPALLGAIVISIVSWVLSLIVGAITPGAD
jgi:putative membrane protein